MSPLLRGPALAVARPLILGVETSCDETAAAVVNGDGHILSTVVSSQHDLHGKFGGVVPELASRRQIETIEAVTLEAVGTSGVAWIDLNAIAVTRGPGLAGARLVGLSFAKGLAYALKVPLIAMNHLEGHIASAWIAQSDFPTPCIVLVASGGHTHLFLADRDGSYALLGQTLDDAAGEAFDKAAKMLGLEYPGGPAIDRLAQAGNARAVRFPRAYLRKGSLDFSFSGLKTSLLYHLRGLDQRGQARPLADLAASFQEAIVEVLVDKAFEAVHRRQLGALAVVGGVSANSRLRALLSARASSEGIRLSLPPLCYCTDNAAMVAFAAQHAFAKGRFESWDVEAEAELPMPEPVAKESALSQRAQRKVAG
jgi:N6-L-threonylcarbamoyladenine synthase